MRRHYPAAIPAHSWCGPSRERGMALLIALIVLIVVSILGVAAMRVALFQSRVSVNSQTENLAFQAAESGLNVALTQARNEIAGGVLPSEPGHLFNKATNNPTTPQRVCLAADGVTISVTADGIYEPNGLPGYVTPCTPLPGSNVTVTTVVGRAPDEEGGVLEAYDPSSGAVLLLIRAVAYGAVPDTNVTSVHAQDWGVIGPSKVTEGM